MADSTQILGWSTRAIPDAQRRDYCVAALASGLEPMQVDIGDDRGFGAELHCLPVAGLIVARGTGPYLRCIRERRGLARSDARSIHLVLNRVSDWTIRHRGAHRVRTGDVMLPDSAYVYDFTFPSFDNAHLVLSEEWLQRWLPGPVGIGGLCVAHDSTWGRAFAATTRTFAGVLMAARVRTVLRMLRSPLFRRLTVAEIGRRAGFADASHFTRVVRARTGLPPRSVRATAALGAQDSGRDLWD